MILTWKVPYSKADFAKMPLRRLAPHFEIELGLFDDEWEMKNDQLIFNPCSVCILPWITPLRMVTYDIIVTYDAAKEKLQFKFRLFKLYVISMLFAAFPLLGGEIVEGGIVFLACFSLFFIVFFIELVFWKSQNKRLFRFNLLTVFLIISIKKPPEIGGFIGYDSIV